MVIAARRPAVLEATAQELRRAGARVLAVTADVTSAADVERLIQVTVSEFGGLDVLVNNAGTGRAGHFETVDDATWDADLDVKLRAAIRTTRAALPQLKQRGGGRIINVTTPAGKQPGGKSLPTSVSRAAGIALTKALSKDLAEYRILVNTVCVGLIKSAQHERKALELGVELDQHYAELGKNVPIGRVGEAEEVANVIVFLASAAGGYITAPASTSTAVPPARCEGARRDHWAETELWVVQFGPASAWFVAIAATRDESQSDRGLPSGGVTRSRRPLQIFALEQIIAHDRLLRFGEGAVGHERLAVADAHERRRFRWAQAVAVEPEPALLTLFHPSLDGTRRLLQVRDAVIGDDEDQIFHPAVLHYVRPTRFSNSPVFVSRLSPASAASWATRGGRPSAWSDAPVKRNKHTPAVPNALP